MLLDIVISASFLVVDPNGARAVWMNSQPTPSQVFPGAQILALPSSYASSQNLNNYQSDGAGNAVYVVPPAPPANSLPPNPAGFKAAILTDATIQANTTAAYALLQLTSLANDYAGSPAGVKAAWAVVIKAQATVNNPQGWLTSQIQTLVEGYATQNNMPLR